MHQVNKTLMQQEKSFSLATHGMNREQEVQDKIKNAIQDA